MESGAPFKKQYISEWITKPIAQLRPSSSLAETEQPYIYLVLLGWLVGWLVGSLSHYVAQHWNKLQTSLIQFWKRDRQHMKIQQYKTNIFNQLIINLLINQLTFEFLYLIITTTNFKFLKSWEGYMKIQQIFFQKHYKLIN